MLIGDDKQPTYISQLNQFIFILCLFLQELSKIVSPFWKVSKSVVGGLIRLKYVNFTIILQAAFASVD